MVIKKVTVKFDNCIECPINRYSGCSVFGKLHDGQADVVNIPSDCPIETSVMMNRFTEFSRTKDE